MERHTTPRSILSTTVFRYALICPCVLLLKTRNVQNGVRIFQFDFVWERNVTGSSPADLGYWTVNPEQSHHQNMKTRLSKANTLFNSVCLFPGNQIITLALLLSKTTYIVFKLYIVLLCVGFAFTFYAFSTFIQSIQGI